MIVSAESSCVVWFWISVSSHHGCSFTLFIVASKLVVLEPMSVCPSVPFSVIMKFPVAFWLPVQNIVKFVVPAPPGVFM